MTGPRPAARVLPAACGWARVLAVIGFLLIGTRQSFTVPFTGLGLSIAQLALFVLAMFWVLTRLMRQRDPAGLGLLTYLLVAQFAITLISYGLATRRGLNADLQSASDRTLAAEFVAAVVVIVLATVLRTLRDIELVLRGLVVGGALSALFALVQYATGVDVAGLLRPPGFAEESSVLVQALIREGITRPQGAATHPLELGATMAMLVPVGIGVALAARSRGGRSWPWALATLVMAAGGVVSLSRSVFVGIGVALLVMIWRWPVRRLINGVLALVVVVVVAALAVPSLAAALTTLFTQGSKDYSLESRAGGRSYVWQSFAQHFWFGQGAGTYDLATQPVLDNQYLSQLMEAGVLGLVALAAVLICAFCYVARASNHRVLGTGGELAGGVTGALAAALMVSAVLDTSGFAQVYTLIWLLVGLAAALWRVVIVDRSVDYIPGGRFADGPPAAVTLDVR